MVESVVQSHAEIVVGSSEKKLIRVLHVDDELGLLKVAKQCLELQGSFHVDTVGSVEEALSKLKEKEYDAVVSDYQMPGKDGLEFLEMLRKNGSTIPFIMFTGKGREEVAVKAWSLGADHYVNKTGDPETVYCELAHCLRSTVEKHFAEAQIKETAQKLQTIYQNAVEGITYVDAEENIVYANKAFADIVGYEPDQLVSMNLRKIADDENWAKIENETRRRRQGESSRYEVEFRRSDGTVRNAQVSGAPLLDHNGRLVGTVGIVLDTTERKKAGEVLKDSEEKFRNLAENSPNMIFINQKGRVVYANRKAEEVMGYTGEEFCSPDFNFLDLIARESKESVKSSFTKHTKGEDVAPYEYKLITREGRIVDAILTTKLITYNGEPAILGTVTDITERKKTEETVLAERDRLETVTRSLGAGLAIISKDYRTLWANDVLKQIFGNVEGKICYSTYNQRNSICPECGVREIFEAGKAKVVHEQVGKGADGKTVWSEITATPVKDRDGNITAALELVVPITQRKKAEEELHHSEEKWRSLVDMAPDGILTTDLKGVITSANNAFLKLTGCTQEEIVGRHFTKLHTIPAKDIPRYAKLMIPALAGKLPPPFEYSYIRKDGRVGWAEARIGVLTKEGKTIGFQAFLRETTERKKVEDQIKKSAEEWSRTFDAITDLVLIIDKCFRLVRVNKSVCDALKKKPEELIGKHCYEVMHGTDKPWPNCPHRKTLETKAATSSEINDPHLGTSLLVTDAPIFDDNGELVQCVHTVKDLSLRKKLEEMLRKSEAKYRSLVEQSAQGIVIAQGPIPHIVFANSTMSKILGYTVEELTSLSPKQTTGLVHPDDRELFFGRFKDRLERKPTPPQYEVRGIRKDGTTVWLELSSARIEYDGQPAVQAIFTDITERKKTEQTLKESEEKYRDLVELAPDGIVAVNVEGIITSTNRSFLTLVGYDSEEEIIGTPFTELMTIRMEDIPKFQGMFKSLMNGESPLPSEFPYVRRDGTSRWAEVHPGLMIKDGHPVGVQAIMRDVSERKNAEKLVQESHQKFEGLFRHNPEAAIYLDVNFKILDVNPRFCQLFGYSAEEAKGRNINEVIVPEDMREEAEGLDKDAKNGYASHNTVRKRKDGSLVPVSISAAPVTFENNLLGYVGIYKDITELKRAQEESEESRKHFQMLFDLMADPVAVVDGRGTILEVTQKVEEIAGFKKEELVGKNLLKVEMFGAKTKAAMIKSLAKRMMGMHVEPYEVEVLKKDGGKLMYEINAAKIDYKGKPADLVVFRDISERRKLEEKLRIVGGLTRHDVRNKLTAVVGNAYLLKKRFAGDPDALECLRSVETAVRESERIFDFASAYEKLGVEELAYVDAKKTLGEAVGLFPDLRGIRIVNECDGLTLLADSLLRQLFYNLIDNSLKYGGKLTQIRIHHEESQDQLGLIYEDDGVGISKDVKPKIFNEGFTTGKGSGYGLYLIRRMMEVYGWAISETGVPGKGAKFTISIPKAKPDGRPNYKLR